MAWEWAICELMVLAVLIREWFSIRRELRRDAEQRSTSSRHAEGQHGADEGTAESRE
jgi:hypothetical protein